MTTASTWYAPALFIADPPFTMTIRHQRRRFVQITRAVDPDTGAALHRRAEVQS